MSKKLRIFLLSVLVIVLGVSSASAALTEYTINSTGKVVDSSGADIKNNAGSVVANFDNTTNTLTINANGKYRFAEDYASVNSAAPIIDSIVLDGTADFEVSEAEFVIPTPYPNDLPAEGTEGAFLITWPTQVRASQGAAPHAVDKTHRVKFTISKRSTNSAILATTARFTDIVNLADTVTNAGTNQHFREGCDLVLAAPVRKNDASQNTTTASVNVQATLVIPDGASFTFDREAEIFANGTEAVKNYPTGYTQAAGASTYTVQPGGELIVRNSWALRGSNLTVDVYPGVGAETENRAVLTLDLPSGTTHDLRGRGETTTGTLSNGSATLIVDGNLNVLSNMTLWGQILTTGQYDSNNLQSAVGIGNAAAYVAAGPTRVGVNLSLDTITKTGAGTLTLSDSGSTAYFSKPSIPSYVRFLTVNGGGLVLASTYTSAGPNTTWEPNPSDANGNAGQGTPTVTVGANGSFTANTLSITQAGQPLSFVVNGTATFKDHAIKRGDDEIYPYGDFITFNNGLKINATETAFTVNAGGKIVVDNGALAAGKIAGKGTIEINNTTEPARDRGVLILADPYGTDVPTATRNVAPPNANSYLENDNYARSYIDFEGTINGTHANVGLYVQSSTEIPFSRRIFQKASVDIENLIVYGPAQLNVDAKTKLDGVANIYLRSHRPGAANYTTTGAVNNAVGYSKLTVGKLNFTPGDTNTDITLRGLKVDGSSSNEDMGLIRILHYDNDAKNENTAIATITDLDGNGNITQDTAPRDYSARDNVVDNLASGINRKSGTVGPRINVYIDNIQLYANRGTTSNDFIANYVNPAKGIYALRIDGEAQPSRFYINNVEGDGVTGDVADGIDQIQIAGQSDVRFTGRDGAEFYPVAHKNSILVEQDAKLEIDRGGVVDGNLTFEPSSTTAWPTYGSHNPFTDNSDYPADEDFQSDEGWYDGLLGTVNGVNMTEEGVVINDTAPFALNNYLQTTATSGYTAFTTQVGERNRRTNESGEYAVRVTGKLKLDRDAFEGYPGRVLVRVKPDLSAFDGYEFTTIGQRFRTIAVADNSSGTAYEDDYATSYNDMFRFRIPADNADKNGVTVENRTELGMIHLDNWSYLAGGEEFGLGDGHNFEIKIPFTVTVRGEEVPFKHERDDQNVVRYYLEIGQYRYYVQEPYPVFFDYEEGLDKALDNVIDINKLAANVANRNTYVSDDITVRAEFVFNNEGEHYVRVIGTSYTGEAPANIRLALYMAHQIDIPARKVVTTATWLNSLIPGFRDYTLIREGVTPPDQGLLWSNAKTEAVGNTDFTVGTEGNVSFKVENVRRATFETNTVASLPTFVDGKYVWDVKAATGTYYMTDPNGKEAQVSDLIVVRWDGDYLKRLTASTDITDITDEAIVLNGGAATVTLPISTLGTTGTAFSAIKGLSLKGRRTDGNGEIISVPVNYTLHAEVSADDTIQVGELLSKTVKIGGESVSGVYDISERELSGDIHLIPYGDEGVPEWLGFYGNGRTISYETGDLTNVTPGTYTFNVLAYDEATGAHKLYTFTVTVEAPVEVHIDGRSSVAVAIGDEPTTVTLTLAGDKLPETAPTWAIATNTNPAGLLTGSANGFIYTLVVNVSSLTSADIGNYDYTITAGTYEHALRVIVDLPEFEIVAESNGFEDYPIDAHTYTAVFHAAGSLGETVEWTITSQDMKSDLYTYHKGDQFIVEGVAKFAQDSEQYDIDQIFTVTAKAGEKTAESETTFTVEADTETYTELTPVSGANDAVAEGYVVNFPTGVTADPDSVFLPSWLEPVMGTGDNEDYVVGVKFAGVAGDLENGKSGTVRIEATNADGDYVYYGWNVKYAAEPAALAITVPAAITFTSPTAAAQTVELSADNALGDVTYTATVSPTTGLTVAVSDSTLTLTPSVAGTYKVTVTATDAGRTSDNTAEAEITVTVNDVVPVISTDLLLTASGTSLTVQQGATNSTITLTARNSQGTVSYTSDTSWVTVSTAGVVTAAPTTAVTAGNYTVKITATDTPHTNGKGTAEITLTITVTAPTPTNLVLTPSRTSVSLTGTSSTGTVELTTTGATGTVTYTTSVTPSTGLTATVSGNTLTLRASAVGTYTVTVTATDGAGKTATATVSVTVSQAALAVSASPATVSFDRPTATAKTVTLSATNAVGSVTYTASVSPTTGLTATVSGTTLTLTPSAAGTYTVTVTATDAGRTTGNTATTTITVTVSTPSVVGGSSGGGCDAGFGALALVLAAPLFLRRRRS